MEPNGLMDGYDRGRCLPGSADDAAELESHLLEEMEALQQSKLQPAEAFVIATRRLGHPRELAVEFAKTDALLSWRRPARLVLWGALFLQLSMFSFGVAMLAIRLLGLWHPVGESLFIWSHSVSQFYNWIALGLLLYLAAKPQGLVARFLCKLEVGIRTVRGATWLVIGMLACDLSATGLRMVLVDLMNRDPNNQVFANAPLSFSLFMLLALQLMAWTMPVVAALIILVRLDHRPSTPQLAAN